MLALMDAGVATAPRVQGWLPNESQERFQLPIWIDNGGWVRIGLPKHDPQHGGDMDQVALRLCDLLAALGLESERTIAGALEHDRVIGD